jgi:hypothetical protein
VTCRVIQPAHKQRQAFILLAHFSPCSSCCGMSTSRPSSSGLSKPTRHTTIPCRARCVCVLAKMQCCWVSWTRLKERLIFLSGWRRLNVSPLFSEFSMLKRHKYQRFLHVGTFMIKRDQLGVTNFARRSLGEQTMATAYAPMQFPPAPLLVLKVTEGPLEFARGLLCACASHGCLLARWTQVGRNRPAR